MTKPMKPLNGEQTHPLRPAALRVLQQLEQRAIPCYQVNPSVVDRLLREGLVEVVELPFRYGKKMLPKRHLRITQEGRAAGARHRSDGPQEEAASIIVPEDEES